MVPRVPPKGQFLKWIGNKHRSAQAIASYLPAQCDRYIEPFVGGGAVLATVAPGLAIAGDTLFPLVELWQLVQRDPDSVLAHYRDLWTEYITDRQAVYDRTLARYNVQPNALDLLFLCRTCYGGVVRFTKKGTMSTPLGPHRAIPPQAFEDRLASWMPRIAGTTFMHAPFEETMSLASLGDVVYCDPPYTYAQQILYGAQSFDLQALWEAITQAKERGALVALSLDGHKKSGSMPLALGLPDGLFQREVFIAKGGSMLKRFQRLGENVLDELVSDRLLLTW
ncbi:MAG: Dam family site-specific DNA-(adenine-N6)-methyltransferase [Actinobacteria bacterium]|nr:Dam family site-specific DNA-(adenine-N6)-methyltransferase [Actinomycetota bacterium]